MTRTAAKDSKLLKEKRQDKTQKDKIAFIVKNLAVLDQTKTIVTVGFFSD